MGKYLYLIEKKGGKKMNLSPSELIETLKAIVESLKPGD